MSDATDKGWYASRIKCNICTKEWASIYPVGTDEATLECPSCGECDSLLLSRIVKTESREYAKFVPMEPLWFYPRGADWKPLL